jgi:hypothetical protein
LEALDVTRFDWRNRNKVHRIVTDLGNELRLLARCVDRLAISKVEAGLIGGLGLACHYYPYVPVGAIREGLFATRRRRAQAEIDPGLFVLLGTAAHDGTGESMAWFARRVSEQGLPAGARVVAVGEGTDRLLPARQTVPGLECRGWIRQEELDALLTRAAAAVIPQQLGFGALTRLPELACAGVPVITYSHPAYAINPTPGMRSVAPDWAELCAAMRDNATDPAFVDGDAYTKWEAQQPRPMGRVLGTR